MADDFCLDIGNKDDAKIVAKMFHKYMSFKLRSHFEPFVEGTKVCVHKGEESDLREVLKRMENGDKFEEMKDYHGDY